MTFTPPALARSQKRRPQKHLPGTVISFTTVRHPPAGFPPQARTIGLIELENGERVCAQLIGTPVIGSRVLPRMRLSSVTAEKLRVYDVAYEIAALDPAQITEKEFQGYILALTGPSGVGKTTVSRMLIALCGDYAEQVPILTTRSKKDGDDGEYRYVNKEEFGDKIVQGSLAAYTHIPSGAEERWYGYRVADVERIWKSGKLPVVITEMRLLDGLSRHFGRRSILSLGLLPPGRSKRAMLSALLRRLRERGRDTEEHIRDRIKNAAADLDFFRRRADLFDHLLVNDDLSSVVETVRKHVPGLAS